MRRLIFLLVLASAIPGGAQPATDAAAYARAESDLRQAEQALLERYFLPEADITPEALQEIERLHGELEDGYFRDLAQRSGLLQFLTRQEAERQAARRSGEEIAGRLLQESRLENRQAGVRRGSATTFWSALGSAAVCFAGSFGCWYAAGSLDRRYLASTTTREAARLKAWSALFAGAGYTAAGVGMIGVAIAVPALAGLRPR